MTEEKQQRWASFMFVIHTNGCISLRIGDHMWDWHPRRFFWKLWRRK